MTRDHQIFDYIFLELCILVVLHFVHGNKPSFGCLFRPVYGILSVGKPIKTSTSVQVGG